MLHIWYHSRSVHPTRFCDVICSLVYNKCMNIFDAMFLIMVGGRNDEEIQNSLGALSNLMVQAHEALQAQQYQQGEVDEFRGLSKF